MNDNKDKITSVLKEYWEDLKGNAPYPLFEEVSPASLENIWQDCFLLSISDDGKEYTYEFAGENIKDAYAFELDLAPVTDDELYPESPEFLPKLRETIRLCQPLEYEGAFINRANIDVKFRKILLPLGTNNKVSHIIGAMRWAEF